MNSYIPFWGLLLILDIAYGFLTAPIAISLVVLGWVGPQWLGRYRWLALAAGLLLAAPLALYGINIGYDQYALQRTLDRDETVAGVSLYAGSTVRFYDRDQKLFRSVELRRVTDILGVSFIGTVARDGFGNWQGTLAADQTVSGWLCRSGRIGILEDGTLW